MSSVRGVLSILFIIITIFRVGRCMTRLSTPSQSAMSESNLYDPANSSYNARGSKSVESMSEEERAVYLKDVSSLTKVSDEILPFTPTTAWNSLKGESIAIHYPKDWIGVFDNSTLQNFTFQPKSLKSTEKDVNIFRAVLISLDPIKKLMDESKVEKDKLFPAIANVWWQQKASSGYDVRGLSKVKFLGNEAYKSNGQLLVGEERLTATVYLIKAPQGVYEFTILGNPESMIKYAKTATNILQTLELPK
jgi:hypothetical protein